MCAYSHVYLQRIQDQPDMIDSSFLLMNYTNRSCCMGMKDFAVDTIATGIIMLLAFTRATTLHQELGHRMRWQKLGNSGHL